MNKEDYNFTVFGNHPEKVFDKIWQNKKLEEQGKTDDSSDKLAVIVEGGAMRTILSGGYLVAMHELGLCNIFNKIYGSSAGSIGGAYFLSGQTPYGISIFYEEVNNHDFINLLTVPPHFNIDYLMDVIEHKKAIDVDAIKKHPTELIITATEIYSGEQCFFSNHEDVDLLAAIKASCALPIYYDKPVEINGEKYMDGGLTSFVPIEKAIQDGCKNILILMTDGQQRKVRSHYLPFWFELWRLKKYGRNFINAYFSRPKTFEHILEIIHGQHPESRDINIAAIAPDTTDIHAYTVDITKLKIAYQTSYQFFLNYLIKARDNPSIK